MTNINIVDVSFVVTVFNKENLLPLAIESLKRQSQDLRVEYIFVDDNSSDNSVSVIRSIFNKTHRVKIIEKSCNDGPSVCLNLGVDIAVGKYLLLIDADDILIDNGLSFMIRAIQEEDADFVFGGCDVIRCSQYQLLQKQMTQYPLYDISLTPLDTVLTGKYVRMAYLVTKDIYKNAHGVDERIFIQDESLPIRLAYKSTKMITFHDPVVYATKCDKTLSRNKIQQHHDRFYVYYFAMQEFKDLSKKQRRIMYKRAISSCWKAARLNKRYIYILPYFISRFSSFALDCIIMKCKIFIDNLDVRKNM